jgi:ATP-dependent helicase/nuclease subunit A
VPARPLEPDLNAPAYRVDGRTVPAAAFYAAACDPQRSVVVEACAGAGKTWMLVSRVLRALLDGAEPQQILAITFTRKAAGEMRARLDEWLAAFADTACDHATREAALRDRGADAATAARLAPELGGLQERLLRGGRAVEVRTFHAWFTQLLAHAPLSMLQALQLPLRHELMEDAFVLRDALLRRFHRAVNDDEALRAAYLALVARHGRSTVLAWLDAAWRRGPEIQRADAAGHAEGGVPPAAALWPACAGLADPAELLHLAPLARELDALARQLGQGKALAAKAADKLRAALETADAAAAFERACDALFTQKGEPRKSLGDSPLQLAVADALRDIQAMRAQQQAHQDHAAMLRLARVLLAQFAQLKRRRGLVDMPDLERAAEALLGDSELAGWVQERLDQRLRHVLIDEFQDTSPLQWQALQGWLSSYAGAGGGASGQRPPSVFIVGDPKQSIYRFRNAEPRVFAAAREFVALGLEGQVLECDHTRRNATAVIAALNAVFSDAALADGWGPYRTHTTGADEPGSVRSLPGVPYEKRQAMPVAEGWRDSLTEPRREPEERRRAAEAAQVAEAVAELVGLQGLLPGEVMVLARTRAMLAEVAQALAACGLPHVVAEPLKLQESPEALDLIALLDALASPAHDLALARALRSPLFGASDADLLWLSREAAGRRTWLGALCAAATLPSAALARAQRLLARWHVAVATLTPHDLLDRIVHEGEVVARLAAAVPADRRAAALQAVDALLAAALAHQGARLLSVYAFVRELRAGRVVASGAAPAQAVQLLTVHGAKGLEARAVIIADSDPAGRPPERATVLVDWPVEQAAPRRIAFVRSLNAAPPSLSALIDDEARAARREELNGLYVAMTRARERLIFSHTEPHRAAEFRSWWTRAHTVAQPWSPCAVSSPPAIAPAVSVPVLPALTWRPAAASAPGTQDAAAARLGQAVHRVLEWAGRPGSALAAAELPAASAAAAAAFGLAGAEAARVQTIAAAVLASPACARFFSGPALRWAGNEVPMSDGGEPLRIDRLVALAEPDGRLTWWVLDYKLQTGAVSLPLYQEQVRRYIAAVQVLQPGDVVRGVLVTGRGEVLEV